MQVALHSSAPSAAPFELPRRIHARLIYTEPCMFHTCDRSFNAKTLNISKGGISVRIQGLGSPNRGTEVALSLQNFPPIHAKICWAKDRVVGMQFTAPLEHHPCISDLIARLREGKPAWIQQHESDVPMSSEVNAALSDEIRVT